MPPNRGRTSARIALVGMPGAGKSTVGHLLAHELGWLLFDCDAAFEAEAGESIAGWVAVNGWTAFRERERTLLAAALGRERLVIATGGGAVEKAENRAALAASAAVFWLDAPPAVLADRLGAAADRPLLADAPAVRIGELYERRRPFYTALADVRIDVADCTPPEAAARIMRILNRDRLIP